MEDIPNNAYTCACTLQYTGKHCETGEYSQVTFWLSVMKHSGVVWNLVNISSKSFLPLLATSFSSSYLRNKRRYQITTQSSVTGALKMIGKGFYRKWVKSSFEQFITTQTRVGSTNGRIISQNAEILKFYFSTIFGICDVIKWLRLRGCALSLVLQCVYTSIGNVNRRSNFPLFDIF